MIKPMITPRDLERLKLIESFIDERFDFLKQCTDASDSDVCSMVANEIKVLLEIRKLL